MNAIVEMISTGSVTDLLRVVWMEVAMASFAATVYFTFSGYVFKPDKSSKPSKGPQRSVGKTPQRESALGGYQLVTKALRQGEVGNAIDLLKKMPETIAGYVPANVAPRLLMAVAKSSDFENVMTQLCALSLNIEARSFEAAANEAATNKDKTAGRQIYAISRLMSIPMNAQMLEAFAKACASDAACLRMLIESVEAPLAKPFAKIVLEACTAIKDVDLAAEVFEKVAESDAAALRAIVEKAASQPTIASAPDSPSMRVAIEHSKAIRACGKNGDLDGAVNLFEKERKHCQNSCLDNAIMDVCVECSSPQKAIEYFNQAKDSGLADAIIYNTAVKCYLAQGKIVAAKGLLPELSEKGFALTRNTYHTFLNFFIGARNLDGAWKVVEEMQAADVQPTAVTCSMLLKGKLESRADMSKVLGLVDTIEPMDEVLFHALAEACVRTGQLQLLSKYQAKLSSQGSSPVLTAPTYGSMIKAYGQARDVKQVWTLWSDMMTQGVQPTAITLGCMVEALVSNRHIVDAWKLVQQMHKEESTKSLVNIVIYSTIIKGFANAKETDKVMALYEEMKSEQIQPNNITFNTILNAFAHGGAMHRVPALLEDMKRSNPPAEPDIITYSTLVKGYCNSGGLDRALDILKDMQSEGKLAPDEVMYNSLLDGCAKEQRPNEALKLLDDMKKTGVKPSNYTLSMIVKLMGRCRRLSQAFSIIEEISSQYGLKVNIQVYTCLIQACFNNRQALKAVSLHDKIIKEGLLPDEMLYSALVKGCLNAGLVDKAVHLAKCAHGLTASKFRGTPPGINARVLDELVSALGGRQSRDAQALLAEISASKNGNSTSCNYDNTSSKDRAATPPWRQ